MAPVVGVAPAPNTSNTTLPPLLVTAICADLTPLAVGWNVMKMPQPDAPAVIVAPRQFVALAIGNSVGFDVVMLETVSEPLPVADRSKLGLTADWPTTVVGKA